jgi:very-short-patch-repair endonuclease
MINQTILCNDTLQFSKNLEELLEFITSPKNIIVRYLKNNFKEHIHFIVIHPNNLNKKHGGNNKIDYLLTEKSFELVKNSFNLKNRYLTKIIENCCHVNLLMSLENQTIGFIENSFKDILKTKRQKIFGEYRVDLYFYDFNLIIECDENDHKDRNIDYEKKREEFLLLKGNSIIRYDPNHKNFDLSFVLREINKFVLIKDDNNKSKLVIVNFN